MTNHRYAFNKAKIISVKKTKAVQKIVERCIKNELTLEETKKKVQQIVCENSDLIINNTLKF